MGVRTVATDGYLKICTNYMETDRTFQELQNEAIEQARVLNQSPTVEEHQQYTKAYNNLIEYYKILRTNEYRSMPPLEKGLVRMTPKEYLERVSYDIYGCTMLETVFECDCGQVKKYAADMRNGDIFPLIYLDYTHHRQEGRHRSLAYYTNGCNEIPVLIY